MTVGRAGTMTVGRAGAPVVPRPSPRGTPNPTLHDRRPAPTRRTPRPPTYCGRRSAPQPPEHRRAAIRRMAFPGRWVRRRLPRFARHAAQYVSDRYVSDRFRRIGKLARLLIQTHRTMDWATA